MANLDADRKGKTLTIEESALKDELLLKYEELIKKEEIS